MLKKLLASTLVLFAVSCQPSYAVESTYQKFFGRKAPTYKTQVHPVDVLSFYSSVRSNPSLYNDLLAKGYVGIGYTGSNGISVENKFPSLNVGVIPSTVDNLFLIQKDGTYKVFVKRDKVTGMFYWVSGVVPSKTSITVVESNEVY